MVSCPVLIAYPFFLCWSVCLPLTQWGGVYPVSIRHSGHPESSVYARRLPRNWNHRSQVVVIQRLNWLIVNPYVCTVYVSTVWLELWRLIPDGACCSPGLRTRLPQAVASATSRMMSSTCPFPPSSPTVTTVDDKRSQIYFLVYCNQSHGHVSLDHTC